MSIPKVSNENLIKIRGLFDLYSRVHSEKAKAVTTYLDSLSEVELWLFSFTYYIMIWNRRWKGVDFSVYYMIPCAKNQTSTFEDFIKLLARYSQQVITHKNERDLIIFLQGCTPEVREYYELIMSCPKEAENFFMKKELRAYLDLNSVRPEDIYGDSCFLNTDWKHLTYPLMITTAPAANLRIGIIHKSNSTFSISKYVPITHNGYKYKRERLPAKWLDTDRKAIHTNAYLLVGVIDEEHGNFYPIDYFNNALEYLHFNRKYQNVLPYEQRLVALEQFLSVNYLRQIKRLPKEFCVSSSQIENAIAKVLLGSPERTLLLSDSKDRILYVETVELEGIIGDYWRNEVGEVLGLQVWNNGRAINCSFDFTGDNHALLYNPQLVINKYASFHLFKHGNFEAGLVREILFDKPLYRPQIYTFRDGTEGYIECCPFCLRDNKPHSHNGICDRTLKNWWSMFATHGVDTWFQVSAAVQRLRKEKLWRKEFLNNVTAVYKGYRVIANDAGEIMFQTDPEAMALYEKRVEALTKAGRMPKIKYKTPEELKKRYAERYLAGQKEQVDAQ